MATTNSRDMCRHCAPILRGCQKRWHAHIVVKPWTCNHGSHMEKYTTYRERRMMCNKNLYHIGDTKSAQELEVFLRMPRERLRLCCGIQCTDSMHPQRPRQRQKLFIAALKLLRFAVGIETVCCENEDKVHCKRPSCHSPGWMMGMYWLLLAQLFWPCVKDVLAWLGY